MAEQPELSERTKSVDIVNTAIDDEGQEMNSQRSSLQSDGYKTCESGEESDGYNSGKEEQVALPGQNEINTTEDGYDSGKEESNLLPGQASKHPHQGISASKEEENTKPKRKKSIQSLVRKVFHKPKEKYPEEFEHALNAAPSEKKLNRIALVVNPANRKIHARELDVMEKDLVVIAEENSQILEQQYQIFYKWTVNSSNPTYRELLNVLKKQEKKEVINEIIEIIKQVDADEKPPHTSESQTPINMNNEEMNLTLYEEEDCDGNNYIHVKYRLKDEIDKNVQVNEMYIALGQYLTFGDSQSTHLPEEEPLFQNFEIKLNEIKNDLGNVHILLSKADISFDDCQHATVENQMLINQTLALLTFSEGKVENVEKLQEVIVDIERCEILLSERMEKYSLDTSSNTMRGQMAARKKQRERLKKLLEIMHENFSKEKATHRQSMYPPHFDRARFRSRRLKTETKAKARLPSLYQPEDQLGSEEVEVSLGII